MKQKGLSRKYVFFAVVLCLVCIVMLSLTSGVDGDHECTGDSCVMCIATALREQILNITVLFFCAVAAFALPLLALVWRREETFFSAIARTPVDLKVKLSN